MKLKPLRSPPRRQGQHRLNCPHIVKAVVVTSVSWVHSPHSSFHFWLKYYAPWTPADRKWRRKWINDSGTGYITWDLLLCVNPLPPHGLIPIITCCRRLALVWIPNYKCTIIQFGSSPVSKSIFAPALETSNWSSRKHLFSAIIQIKFYNSQILETPRCWEYLLP